MKVLYITLVSPGDLFGAALAIKQAILSLAQHFELDYVGPAIMDDEAKSNVTQIANLQPDTNPLSRGLHLLRGITSDYFSSWMRATKEINWNEYDIAYLDFSRHDFIAHEVKQHPLRLIVRLHNVEHDFYENMMNSNRGLQYAVRFKYICKQEPNCLSYADRVVVLTNEDKVRLLELYPGIISDSQIRIVPICVKQPMKTSNKRASDEQGEEPNVGVSFLITGSLWYGPNRDGVLWFLQNVWNKLHAIEEPFQQKSRLVLAGAKPSNEIRSLVERFDNILLVDSPEDMNPYFEGADVYIAPIFYGTGMKVKVAEALSYGLPIIGTSHALIGYDNMDRESGYCADSEEQIIGAIRDYLGKSRLAKDEMHQRSFATFSRSYSMERSAEYFNELICDLIPEQPS